MEKFHIPGRSFCRIGAISSTWLEMKTRRRPGSMFQELGSPERRTLLNSKTLAVYAKGPSGRPYLLFPRDRALLAQPLDLSRFELYGEPVAVAAEVSYNTNYGTSAFSVSDNGVLAYRSGTFGA